MAVTELPFERAAMRGEEMPDGLLLSEQKVFIALRSLYAAYRRGEIERERASREKQMLIRQMEHEIKVDELNEKISQLWKRIEIPASEYAKNPTRKIADAFYAAVYGLPEDWRNDRNKLEAANVPWGDMEGKWEGKSI